MDKLNQKECPLCSSSFYPRRVNSTFCNEIRTWTCEICSNSFDRLCKGSQPRACSKSCTSKLIRRDQGLKNLTDCLLCGTEFPAVVFGALYCNRIITRSCKGCQSDFERECNGALGSYCSTSCRMTYMRATSYRLSSINCKHCGLEFTPKSTKQIYCKSHLLDCKFCMRKFEAGAQTVTLENRGHYCDNICSTLSQTDSLLDISKIDDYKDPNGWAKKFKIEFGRKPMFSDFRSEFNTAIPKSADRSLFSKKRDSAFELSVIKLIQENYPELTVLRRKKIIFLPNEEFPKEIDIYIPELKLGFEVQDFTTHSRDSNDEESCFTNPDGSKVLKRGPDNHEAKRSAMMLQLDATLVDIWEDEIKMGHYRKIVTDSIDASFDAILVK